MFNIGIRVARELRVPEVAKALVAELDRSSLNRQLAILVALADRGDAEALPAALKAAQSGPLPLRIEAIGVLERLGKPSAVPVLVAAAGHSDPELSQAAKLALTRLPGADVDAAVVGMLKGTDVQGRITAIELIGQRHVTSAMPALMKSTDDPDESVRVASIRVIGDLAGDDQLPTMISMLVKSKSPAEMDAAERAVSAICIRQSKPVAGKVVIKKAMYGALPNGPAADVTQKVADLVKGGAMAVEASNGNFGDPAQNSPKSLRIEYSVEGTSDTKVAKEGESITLTAAVTPSATVDALGAALAKAPTQPKLALLRVLRSTRSPKALSAVRAAAADPNAEIKDAALSILCDWPTAEALPDLTQLAKTSTDAKIKILALRGVIRLIPQQDASVDKKLAGLKEAMSLAERTEEKRLALAALGNIPTVESLALVTPHLAGADLKEEASAAAVSIAEKIVENHKAEVAAAMEQVTKATGNQQVAKRAQEILAKAK